MATFVDAFHIFNLYDQSSVIEEPRPEPELRSNRKTFNKKVRMLVFLIKSNIKTFLIF